MKNNRNLRFRTPLKRVIGVGAAHSGTKRYQMQLLTAVINVPIFIIFIFCMIGLFHKDYHDCLAFLSHPCVALIFLAMLISGIVHMYLGMRVILEDYISAYHCRIFAQLINIAFCTILGGLSVLSVLKITIGG